MAWSCLNIILLRLICGKMDRALHVQNGVFIEALKSLSNLRDEQVRFADFIIQELAPLSAIDYKAMSINNKLKLNKSKGVVSIKEIPKNSYEEIELIDGKGKRIAHNRLVRKRK